MTAEAVSKDKLFAHADILDQGDMGWTVIGAGAAFDTGTNVAGQAAGQSRCLTALKSWVGSKNIGQVSTHFPQRTQGFSGGSLASSDW